jgi:hypothetical protein
MTIIAAAQKRSEVSACNFGVAGDLSTGGTVAGMAKCGREAVTGLSRVAIIHAPRVPCRTAAHPIAYGVLGQDCNADATVRAR